MTVITRFAPSPTGALHLGGARTALFNYLHAKKYNGKFRLRIEDTDRNRSTKESSKVITESLQWLGLHVDDDVVFQSENQAEHLLIAESLLAKGLAYKCFHDKEYVQQFSNSKKKFYSEWRDKQNKIPTNKNFCIRIKSPVNHDHIIKDKIQGNVKVSANEIDDYIIVRSDGTPTFLLSSAADDFKMKITDIIRGDDHLTNSFRQKIIFDFLNYQPNFAHISLIHNKLNQKMSKRDNSTSLIDYKIKGYLPEAIINYLARLGWSYGDQEIFSIDFLKKNFEINSLGKSPAKYDEQKLNFLNNYYIKNMRNEKILNYIQASNERLKNIDFFSQKELIEIISIFKDRSSSLNDISSNVLKMTSYKKDFTNEEKIILENFEKYKSSICDKFSSILEWNEFNIENKIKEVIQYYQIDFKSIGKPLRLLITGSSFGPSLFKIIKVMGLQKTIKRINRRNFCNDEKNINS